MPIRGPENSGGECPLCSRTFSRTRDLMEHCSTCEGGGGAGASNGGGRGKSTSQPPKPSTPKVNLSECPICSKKVPSKNLERHARSCAENMFGWDGIWRATANAHCTATVQFYY